MKIVRDIIRPVVVLVVITLVVSAALALTYQLTKPEEGAAGPDMELIGTAGKEAMPEADGFTQLDQTAEGAVYMFRADNGAGILIQGETSGYDGPITFLIGFDAQGAITGIKVLSHTETPGLGGNIETKEFTDRFIGKTGDVGVKTGDANEIDAITGATISSKAMCTGVNQARLAFEAVKGELSK